MVKVLLVLLFTLLGPLLKSPQLEKTSACIVREKAQPFLLDSTTVHTFVTPPTKDEVVGFLDSIGVQFPKVVYAQALIESGCGRSGLSRKFNNFLGMNATNRSYCIGKVWCASDRSWKAVFPSWKHCFLDYKEWQTSTPRKKELLASCKTEEEYILFLKKVGYAVNPDYAAFLKKNM